MIPTWSSTAAIPHVTYPPASLFDIFPPSPEPAVLSPPQSDRTLARPFNINPEIYNELLNVQWPLVVATVYAIVVYFLNNANRNRQNKPWAISKSWAFIILVSYHNIFLAGFSIWTFVGMTNAIRQSWPGLHGEGKWAEAADALCKMNGPRGLGSAATFNPSTSSWGFTDSTMKLLDNLPDKTDVGRLWNEGLGFYGWLFYVSKLYEVVDTLIILAQGKNSSFLQTFHHTGAMLCMWAGIRYMSPPIWMFVFINSGLHGPMYIYYALSTIGFKVPIALKKVLTGLQITQIVFGISYAVAHLFVAYDIPVSVPYLFTHNLSSAIPSAVSSVSSAVASATASASLQSWLKKAALRAAGEEGLAMNVRNEQGEAFGIDAVHAAESEKAQEETRYRMEYKTIHCLDTSGQVFAILLNTIYLLPLTFLFFRFFVNNYILGTKNNVPPASRTEVAQDSAKAAIRDLEEEIKKSWDNVMHEDETEVPPEIKAALEEAESRLKRAKSKIADASKKPRAEIGEKFGNAKDSASQGLDAAQQEAREIATKSTADLKEALNAIKTKAQNGAAKAQEKGAELKDQAGKKVDELKDKASGKAQEVKKEAEDGGERAKNEAEDKADAVKEEADTKTKDSNNTPKEEPDSQSSSSKSTENAKPKESKSKIPKRDKSPVKRGSSPAKLDPKSKGKENVNGETNGEGKEGKREPNGLDESAYEINPDELKDEEEVKAEKEMQPKGVM